MALFYEFESIRTSEGSSGVSEAEQNGHDINESLRQLLKNYLMPVFSWLFVL